MTKQGRIYAVRMREYCKPRNCLARTWSSKFNRDFVAGDATPRRAFRPSPIVEVTKEEYEYYTGRDSEGRLFCSQPNHPEVPLFDGWIVDKHDELVQRAQGEADRRASKGEHAARAMVQTNGKVTPAAVPHQVVTPSPLPPMAAVAVELSEPTPMPTPKAEPPVEKARQFGRTDLKEETKPDDQESESVDAEEDGKLETEDDKVDATPKAKSTRSTTKAAPKKKRGGRGSGKKK